MKKQTKLLLSAVVVVGTVILTTGCRKPYNSVLDDAEDIGKNSAVTIDGHTDGGKVTRVYVDPSGRRVVQFTTGSESLRCGTVRVRAKGVLDLRSANQNADVLPAGAFIPVESHVGYIADKWSGKGVALIGIAAVTAALCLQRFLAFRAAAPLIPLIGAVGLALITAYSTHGFLVPLVQEIQAQVFPATGLSAVSSGTPATLADGWIGKARGIESQVVEFLRTPVDGARVLAFLVTFLISLPLYACLIGWLFRRLRCQPVVCGLLLLACLPSGSTAASVKREAVESRFRGVEVLVLRAEELGAEARRLDKAGLKDQGQACAIRAYVNCERATIMEEGAAKEIDSLSAWRASAETRASLHASFRALAKRRAGVEDALADIAGSTTNSLTRIYLIERADVQGRLRAGDLDEGRLITQLLALSRVPLALVRERVVSLQNLDRLRIGAGKIQLPDGQVIALAEEMLHGESTPEDSAGTTSELARLQRQQVELQDQLAELRRAQSDAVSTRPVVPQIVVITNHQVVEKLVPAAAPPPVIKYVTNREIVTNYVATAPKVPPAGASRTPGQPPIQPEVRSHAGSLPTMTNRAETADRAVGKVRRDEDIGGNGGSAGGNRNLTKVVTNAGVSSSARVQNGNSAPKSTNGPNATGQVPRMAEAKETTSATKTNAPDWQKVTAATRMGTAAPPMRRFQGAGTILITMGMGALLLLLLWARGRAGEPVVVKLLINDREVEFDVEAGRDALFLDKVVFSEERRSPHDCPTIEVRRGQAFLRLPKGGPLAEGGVRVNGQPVSKRYVLQPGDVIVLARPSQPAQSIKFLGHAEAVPVVNEAEIECAPTNSTA